MLISVRKINNLKEQPRVIKCRNYTKYDPKIFCSDLKKIPWDTVLSSTNVDELGLCGSTTLRLSVTNTLRPTNRQKSKRS